MESAKLLTRSFDTTFLAVSVGGTVQRWPPNGEVEGPSRSARWRRGRTISQRPRRLPTGASRPPPPIVRAQQLTGTATNGGGDYQAYSVDRREDEHDYPSACVKLQGTREKLHPLNVSA